MDNALPSYLSGFVQSFCHCGNEKKYSWELKSSKLGRKWTQIFFPCSMLKNVWVQAVKIRITTCILTVSSQFRKKCANNWQICMFLKNFEQRISPMKAFFLLFSSQNSSFFQILEHYVHRSRQPPHHLMSTLMMIIFSFVFRSDGAMIPKWKFSSGFKQKKNSLPASFLISEKKVYFEIGKIVYL